MLLLHVYQSIDIHDNVVMLPLRLNIVFDVSDSNNLVIKSFASSDIEIVLGNHAPNPFYINV